jgi:hypothetical protein
MSFWACCYWACGAVTALVAYRDLRSRGSTWRHIPWTVLGAAMWWPVVWLVLGGAWLVHGGRVLRNRRADARGVARQNAALASGTPYRVVFTGEGGFRVVPAEPPGSSQQS